MKPIPFPAESCTCALNCSVARGASMKEARPPPTLSEGSFPNSSDTGKPSRAGRRSGWKLVATENFI